MAFSCGATCSPTTQRTGWGDRRAARSPECREWVEQRVCEPGFDVLARGNCLYHVVWTTVELAGNRPLFNIPASAHVFDLRVDVGSVVVRLLREETLNSVFSHEPLHVGELVALPNQWAECARVIPITAMAYMVNRRIVTLWADNITSNETCNNELIGDLQTTTNKYDHTKSGN